MRDKKVKENNKKLLYASVITVIAIIFYAAFAQPLAYNAIIGKKSLDGYFNDLLNYWGIVSSQTCERNCDFNHDGICDLNCDDDLDGVCDRNCDYNHNGKCDLNCDTDNDKVCDYSCDTDNDKKCNKNCDTNEDGVCDLNCDTNNDGKCDKNCDINGDNKCDLNCYEGEKCKLNCDDDGDEICDRNCDTNNDGKCNKNCDDNNDKICDRNCDTNNDGKCNRNCDTDNDGKCDLNCDTNNDGICDKNCDINNDGKCDKNCDEDTKTPLPSEPQYNSNWLVSFTDVVKKSETGNVKENSKVKYSSTSASFDVSLTGPGDAIEYEFTVTNQGTIDAKIDNIEINPIGSNDYINFEVLDAKTGDTLDKGKSMKLTVRISLKSVPETIVAYARESVAIHINYVQN